MRKAEAIRDRVLNEVAEKRNPRTSVAVDQLLNRYLDQFDGAPNTLTLYCGYVRNHISPLLGPLKVTGAISAALPSAQPEVPGVDVPAGHRADDGLACRPAAQQPRPGRTARTRPCWSRL